MRELFLAVRAAFFVLLLPGTVAGYIPFSILRAGKLLRVPDLGLASVCAAVFAITGALVLLRCVWDFFAAGKGTLAPIDPPRFLVVRGLYRFTRNPMYNGVIALILGLIGGIVGQMLEHGRAVDDMLLGLMIPSSSQWRQGAARLQVAVLDPPKLPPDGGQTEAARQARVRVHRLADQAVAAGTPEQRAGVYREVLGSCAQCHGLHSKVWGPGRQR